MIQRSAKKQNKQYKRGLGAALRRARSAGPMTKAQRQEVRRTALAEVRRRLDGS
jgi:hypothetical protein